MKRNRLMAVGILTLTLGLTACYLWIRSDISAPDVRDFVVERIDVDPGLNAYTCLLDVISALQSSGDDAILHDHFVNKSVDQDTLTTIVASNAAVFAAVDKACKRPLCQLPRIDSWSTPSLAAPFLKIGRLLWARSTVCRLTGKPEESLHSALTLVELGNMFQANPESAIDYLVGLVLILRGMDGIEQLLDDGQISPAGISRLDEVLGEVHSLTTGYTKALKRDFWVLAAELDTLPKGTLGALRGIQLGAMCEYPVPLYVISGYKPNETKGMIATLFRECIRDVDSPYGQAPSAHRDNLDDVIGSGVARMIQPNLTGKMICATVVPDNHRYLELKCQSEFALASMRVAVALHRITSNDGALPADLPSLVPAHLAAVPRDPFNGQPLRYLPEKGVIYSVGKDLIDSGGSTNRPTRTQTSRGYTRWDCEDYVFKVLPDPK